MRFLENLWGVACHPWPLGPANLWRDDGTGEFSRTRLNIAYHVIPAGMPGPSARDGNRVWLRPWPRQDIPPEIEHRFFAGIFRTKMRRIMFFAVI